MGAVAAKMSQAPRLLGHGIKIGAVTDLCHYLHDLVCRLRCMYLALADCVISG
uniref:Uncharacterized protein n=1 Tax=Arundo donax TaxID=35708 RepID=A0A0A9G1W3_ARUDO